MTPTHLLDTGWIIRHLRGNQPYRDTCYRIGSSNLALSIVSLAELYEGVYRATDQNAARQKLVTYISDKTLLPVTTEICRMFGEHRARLRQRNLLIGDFDLPPHGRDKRNLQGGEIRAIRDDPEDSAAHSAADESEGMAGPVLGVPQGDLCMEDDGRRLGDREFPDNRFVGVPPNPADKGLAVSAPLIKALMILIPPILAVGVARCHLVIGPRAFGPFPVGQRERPGNPGIEVEAEMDLGFVRGRRLIRPRHRHGGIDQGAIDGSQRPDVGILIGDQLAAL
jgi:tRNA(fMet)-specific endonuclease VapC